MSSILLRKEHLAEVKKALREEYPEVGSSHLSEALAAALGFRTHASLIDAMQSSSDNDYVLLVDEDFDSRLKELGHEPDLSFGFELIDSPVLLKTTCRRAYDIHYKSQREKAYRNMVVAAVNEGLRRKLFTLRPEDNRWPGWTGPDNPHDHSSVRFSFELPNGLPAMAYAADAGYSELAINVAICPEAKASDWLSNYQAGFKAGNAFAASWLERERGAWIQSATGSFKCRNSLLGQLASMEIRPAGYGDRGRVIM
ncbi:hypothetical protein ACXZ1M_13475 [Duganella sp. PWIR1]